MHQHQHQQSQAQSVLRQPSNQNIFNPYGEQWK